MLVAVAGCRSGYELVPLPNLNDDTVVVSTTADDSDAGDDDDSAAEPVEDPALEGGDGAAVATLAIDAAFGASQNAIQVHVTATGGALGGVWVACGAASEPAPLCQSGALTPFSTLGSRDVQVAGLNPNTAYACSVCVASEDDPSVVSTPTTFRATTLPACDDELAGTYTFAQFQSRLDALNDVDSDGVRTMCLQDGFVAQNTNASATDHLYLLHDDFVMYAPRGAVARIENLRTNGAGYEEHAALGFDGADNVRLANLVIRTAGYRGTGLYFDTHVGPSSGAILERLTVQTTGSAAKPLHLWGASVASMQDVVLRSMGDQGYGLILREGSSILSMDRVTIARMNSAVLGAVGVMFDNVSATSFVHSANVGSVTVCAMAGSAGWQADGGFYVADGNPDLPATWAAPSGHVPSDETGSQRGAQTLPGPDVQGSDVVFGGTCPLTPAWQPN